MQFTRVAPQRGQPRVGKGVNVLNACALMNNHPPPTTAAGRLLLPPGEAAGVDLSQEIELDQAFQLGAGAFDVSSAAFFGSSS
ncbi:hypothetical protein [Streptomyces sp. FIT100]|uniref:hypothetical protein n=1 Tax=Streptomyces sp. FIT100 TaxID=2837956 RepID=UPI0021C7CDD4|nr:hypothetical protein [Streptomyces sp. FIT100]UUN30058.1 hypothetical protein KK483_29590 [Streptomyces sp. FIT100]